MSFLFSGNFIIVILLHLLTVLCVYTANVFWQESVSRVMTAISTSAALVCTALFFSMSIGQLLRIAPYAGDDFGTSLIAWMVSLAVLSYAMAAYHYAFVPRKRNAAALYRTAG